MARHSRSRPPRHSRSRYREPSSTAWVPDNDFGNDGLATLVIQGDKVFRYPLLCKAAIKPSRHDTTHAFPMIRPDAPFQSKMIPHQRPRYQQRRGCPPLPQTISPGAVRVGEGDKIMIVPTRVLFGHAY